jgi:fused signal recognition particle receptor
MEELAKISRVVKKVIPDAPHQTLLVLDATTGQNAVSQAKNFGEIVPLTGVVLTKLDGTAKGGVVLSIYEELHVPVKWIGLGEREDDLERFNAKDFAKALFETTDHASGESTKV